MKYGKKEKAEDLLAGVIMMLSMFILVWIAFAADAMTTGM